MITRKFVATTALIGMALWLAPACSGSDPQATDPGAGDSGASDATTATDAVGGGDSAQGPKGECTTNVDCTAKVPVTTPPDCAVAICDTLEKKCHLKSKDADGDGHLAKKCTAAAATIETGDDCDDGDVNTYPGAWDGPATGFDAGPSAQADRCDEKDNDCDGSPDNGKLKVDGGDKSCKCDPTRPLACYEYPNGIPIDVGTLDPGSTPYGACKKGTRTCLNGVPGACLGAVGPNTEQCTNADADCDGKSGNLGDDVANSPIWYRDNDNDNFGAANTPPVQRCTAPDTKWKQSIPNTDCKDDDNAINPGHAEVCDGKDNNCNESVDESVTTHYCQDVDGDSYCTATCVDLCAAPTGYRAASQCLAGIDCNDANGNVKPGASEACNGVDDNCASGADEGYNIGQACTAGNYGVCRRNGTTQCATTTSTTCAPGAGAAVDNEMPNASTDPTIYTGSDSNLYSAKWDWNCSGQIEGRPDNLIKSNFATGAAASYLCQGNYEAACQAAAGSQSQCLPVVYPCNTGCGGVFCSQNQACGQSVTVAYCSWNFTSNTSGCNQYNHTTKTFLCK